MLARGRTRGRVQPVRQHRPHLLQRERLREIVVHPYRQASPAAVFDHARRKRYDRGMPSAEGFAPSDFHGRLEPVHLGHLAIHEDEAVVAARMTVERVPAVDRSIDDATHALENGDADLQVNWTVFHQQHSCPPLLRIHRRSFGQRDNCQNRIGIHCGNALPQCRLPYWLCQQFKRNLLGLADLLIERGQQDDLQLDTFGSDFDGMRQLDARHVGQGAVDDDQPERLLVKSGSTQRGKGRRTVLGVVHRNVPGGQLIVQYLAVERIGDGDQGLFSALGLRKDPRSIRGGL